MNKANKLTVLRIILIFVFMFFLFAQNDYAKYGALVVFILAALTDYFDGKIARVTNTVTKFGILVDPLADKMLISAAFISFVEMDIIPAWMVVIVIGREFAIMGLRTLAASEGKILAAERLGKQKTISQFSIIIIILSFIALKGTLSLIFKELSPYLEDWLKIGINIFMLGVIFLTVISGLSYIGRNRRLLGI
ncbi:MAG: CDP-diacylglycerol--glycerol-3-phosphate 3-phosphatidyltransferase [Candidatus Ratteibacteria bacterium]|nr:CDP-diacylglycerol--glycerol-3-phosphate 3-phosphatidyltransferase [Candidatus Ratteibacteria bacterium]